MSSTDALRAELKEFIVTTLVLEDVTPGEIEDEQILFGEGLGLDSIDALELAVAIEKEYGARLDDSEENRKHFTSVSTLAAFITHNGKPEKVAAIG